VRAVEVVTRYPIKPVLGNRGRDEVIGRQSMDFCSYDELNAYSEYAPQDPGYLVVVGGGIVLSPTRSSIQSARSCLQWGNSRTRSFPGFRGLSLNMRLCIRNEWLKKVRADRWPGRTNEPSKHPRIARERRRKWASPNGRRRLAPNASDRVPRRNLSHVSASPASGPSFCYPISRCPSLLLALFPRVLPPPVPPWTSLCCVQRESVVLNVVYKVH